MQPVFLRRVDMGGAEDYNKCEKREHKFALREGERMTTACLYRRLAVEMYLRGYDLRKLSDSTGMEAYALRRRLRGEVSMKLSEAVAIRRALGTSVPLEELFERSEA